MSTTTHVNKLKAAMQGMAILPDAAPAPAPSTAADALRPAVMRAPSRTGKRNVSAYINTPAAKQLRLMAVDREMSTQALVEEALNDLFRKYEKARSHDR